MASAEIDEVVAAVVPAATRSTVEEAAECPTCVDAVSCGCVVKPAAGVAACGAVVVAETDAYSSARKAASCAANCATRSLCRVAAAAFMRASVSSGVSCRVKADADELEDAATPAEAATPADTATVLA